MRFRALFLVLCAVLPASAENAKSVVQAALKNMGDVTSVQFSGSGATFNLGQSVSPATPYPRAELRSFTRTFDYSKSASRLEGAGPGGPLAVQFVVGDKAWGQGGTNVTPAPAAATERQLQIWLTPHGFLRGALANQATAKKRGKSTLVTFTAMGKYKVSGTISSGGDVESVETHIDNPVLGDMLVEVAYSGYRDFGGLRFPAKIVQKQGGFATFDLDVTGAKANVPIDVAVPDAVKTATVPAVQVTSQKLADGVWYVTGGTHHSLLVEFADHLAVIEAPLNEERSAAVIAESKKLVPGKPIRYLVNTHHHFDHSGGLRTYVAEGSKIVTHEGNKAFYETQVFKAKHTLAPDRLSREKKKAVLITMGSKYVLSDSKNSVELHLIQGSPHNTGILMAYFPKEKLLVEADVYNPPAGTAAPPNPPTPATTNLFENIQKLNLDVQKIAPIHGRLLDAADIRRAMGK